MKYCTVCGATVSLRVPSDDNRERWVCDRCETVHYQNPRIIVGCLATYGDGILLCRRAIEPRHGYWTLPAGFMENGETSIEGALRETWEEAHARVDDPALYTLFDLPHISQVYMFYRADLVGGHYGIGPESLEVALFREHEIPWDQLAFPVIDRTLRLYCADRKVGQFPVRSEVISRPLKR